MISAFGVEHGEAFGKARRGPGVVRGRRNEATSMVERGGKQPYFSPSKKQVAASKARRAEQAGAKAARKAAKPFTPVGGGKRIPLSAHWKAAGTLPRLSTKAALMGGGLLVGVHEANRHIRKADKQLTRREVASGAAGAAGGAGLSFAGLNVAGQTAKATLKQRRATRGVSPHEERIWTEHRKKHPVTSGKTLVERHLKYPKSLPDWRGQRALAFKNRPAVGAAVLAAGAAAGGQYGVREARKK